MRFSNQLPLIRSLLFCSIAAPLAAGFDNCSNTNLEAIKVQALAEPAVQAHFTGQFCTLNQSTATGMKFYFIMDITGSNEGGDSVNGTAVPPTDPGKPGPTHRSEAMTQLAQEYPQAEFALQTFSGDTNGNPTQSYFGFTDSQDFVANSINGAGGFNSIPDAGNTNYDAALRNALINIQNYLTDQAALPVGSRDPWGPMIVIFASDGIPNSGPFDQATLQSDVDAIVNVVSRAQYKQVASSIISEIIVNSGGYGGVFQIDGTATTQYLNYIASADDGLFVNLGTQAIDLSVFAPAPQTASGVLDQFFATNMSVVWDQTATGGAQLNWDSDGDGLSDKTEASLGSNPKLYDSDSDLIGDAIANIVVPGKPCANSGCTTPNSAQADPENPVWTRCLAIPSAEGGGAGNLANDIINNCEKEALQGDYHLFSNAGDNIPDGIKTRFGYSPMDSRLSQTDPDDENVTTLDKIIKNLPPWLPQSQSIAMGLQATSYNVQYSGTQADGRNCYTFDIQNLPGLPNGTNKVRLWMTQTDVFKRDTLRYLDVAYTPGNNISVTDDQFQPNQSQISANTARFRRLRARH